MPACFHFDEDFGHLLFKCKLVKESWKRLDLEELRQNLIGMNLKLPHTHSGTAWQIQNTDYISFSCGAGGQLETRQVREN
jgi:hypothetical protein